MPTDARTRTYRFDEFTLHPAERQLLRNGTEIELRPKAFETLVCLVRHHGHAVSKADLLDAVWPDTSVSDGWLPPLAVALIHLGLGEDEAVIDRLEEGLEERDPLLPWLKFMPPFDRLHGNPRFQAVLCGMGLGN